MRWAALEWSGLLVHFQGETRESEARSITEGFNPVLL